jgi:demethylmenaquinone methyltransferase/2-methoxy-6-polyprenyl-1,4-benzoquinol methylase
MPTLGKWVSKDSRAYEYLPESVAQFPSGKDFLAVMEKVGYQRVRCIPLSGGIASIYIGEK